MKKALFLDRDGVINKMIKRDGMQFDDSPRSVNELQFNDGIREVVEESRELGYIPLVITNQPSIVKGSCQMSDYEEITATICNYLGLKRNDVLECLHKEGFGLDCECRKPKPGLFYLARGFHEINLEDSVMVGDACNDILAAKNAGVETKIFVKREQTKDNIGNKAQEQKMQNLQLKPDYTISKIAEINWILHSLQPDYSLTKLEIGCGGKPTPGYLHQDITRVNGTRLDFVCNPWEIPLKENSLNEVLALGSMEHLRYEEFGKTLAHMNKLLKKEGVFLFDVPDMKVWSEYLYNLTHGMPEKNPFRPEHIWATVYGWQRWPGDEHKNGWTRESLLQEVKKYGFSNIEEGVQIFTSKGIERGRFTRPGDAHLYIKAIK